MNRCLKFVAFAVCGALFVAACGDDGGGAAQANVAAAQSTFCSKTKSTIQALDSYSKLLVSSSATVKDLRSAGAKVTGARSETEKAANDLQAAIELAAKPSPTIAGVTTTAGSQTTTTTTVPTIEVSDASIKRLKDADAAFDKALSNVSDSTPINKASVEVSSAAFTLEVAWLAVFNEAGCLKDADAAYQKLATYTSALQTDLTVLGFYKGPIDGYYGADTVAAVKAFQKSAGLPETGYPDPATQQAMSTKLAEKKSASIAALQTILKAGGFYTGAIDGVWSPAVEGALKAFQKKATLPETGTMDQATLAALVAAVEQVTSPSTTVATTTTVTSTTTQATTTTTRPAATTAAPTTAKT